jgi:hypothetical protein
MATQTTTTIQQGTTTSAQSDDAIDGVFSSVDLLREILLYLVDEPETLLLEANTLCKPFYSAIMDSDQIWKAVCRYRWIQKWGFENRWQTALDGSSDTNTKTNTTTMTRSQWWRHQYVWHERDAQRDNLTPEELTRLTFDFRFWVMEYFGGQENVVQSGLRFSVGSNFSFLPSREEGIISHQGLLYGHPSNRDDLEWLLDEDGRGLQWGKVPHLWPKAKIVRLDSWGWEIRNPNVCLRAIDSAMISEHRDAANIAGDLQDLWADLLSSIQSYAVRLWPERGEEGLVRIEVPPEFWEFQQNRLRFPQVEP